jgi:hypothetical protein
MQIQWLPHAVVVSAVTGAGLDDLKAAVIRLMSSDKWADQISRMSMSQVQPADATPAISLLPA